MFSAKPLVVLGILILAFGSYAVAKVMKQVSSTAIGHRKVPAVGTKVPTQRTFTCPSSNLILAEPILESVNWMYSGCSEGVYFFALGKI